MARSAGIPTWSAVIVDMPPAPSPKAREKGVLDNCEIKQNKEGKAVEQNAA